MAWFYFFDTITGRLVAAADVMPPTVPPELSILTLAERAPDAQMWDTLTRGFVPRPAKVFGNRLNDMFADAQMVALNLSAARRETLRTIIRRHMMQDTVLYNPAFPLKEP